MVNAFYKNHPFFGEVMSHVLEELDECFEYGIAFSEDLCASHMHEPSLGSPSEWQTTDQAFRFKLMAAQLLTRTYSDVMRNEPRMLFLDYDLKGEFKAKSEVMHPIPPHTLCIDAIGLPSVISSDMTRNADNIGREFFFRQAEYYIKLHLKDIFGALCRDVNAYTQGQKCFQSGSRAANEYIYYTIATIYKGGNVNVLAYEYGLPMKVDKPQWAPSVVRAVDMLKKDAGITP